MPVNPAQTLNSTRECSYLPCYSGKQSRFTFWDAVQVSNALVEFSGLIYEKHLGHGISFAVDLYRVEPAWPEVPSLVAVKTPKISALPNKYASDNGIDLYSLLLEIQVLCHEPIQRHPNIIGVLGVDWKRGIGEIPIPLLIVEYSQFGNLSDFLQLHDSFSTAVKAKICLDIASGLHMIHRCSVVHGDIKLTNVLVFEDENGGFVAKIADFGSSITGFEHEERLQYRGTNNYRAPELQGDLIFSIPELQKCDVFAFGLCVWEILGNGKSYVEGANSHNTSPEGDASSMVTLLDKFDKFLNTADISELSTSMGPDTFLEPPGTARTPRNDTKAMIRDLIHYTIHPIPTNRYTMEEVVKKMSSILVRNTVIPGAEIPALRFQRASVGIWNFSSVENRTPREAQCQAVADLQKTLPAMNGPDKCQALLIISHCYAHGYGVSVNFRETLRYFRLAADAGSLSAEAILPRIADAIEQVRHPMGPWEAKDTSLVSESLTKDLREVENRLSNTPNGQKYCNRLREWSRITREHTRRSNFTVFDGDEVGYDIQPGDEGEMAALLGAKVKHLDTALAISRSTLENLRTPLLQFITNAGWLALLRSLTEKTNLTHLNVPYDALSGPNDSNFGNLLLAAAAQGDSKMVRYLLEQGVSASQWQGNRSTSSVINALHLLFLFPDHDKEEIAKMLVKHGADPNMTGPFTPTLMTLAKDFPIELSGPPMDVAISVGDSESIRVLLALGADPLKRTEASMLKQAHNCLELAVALHLHDIVDAILKHLCHEKRADLAEDFSGLLGNLSGFVIGGKGMFWRWLLHGPEYQQNCILTIKTCIEYGISIDSKDENGLNALIVATNRNPCQYYVLEALLECGANPNSRDNEGQTPLHQCKNIVWDPEDNVRTVCLLVKFGANVDNQDNEGDTPTHVHAFSNSAASLRCLVEAGASLTMRNSSGGTPLYMAAISGAYNTAEYLLDAGSDIESLSEKTEPFKLTPLGWSVAFGRTQVMELLLKRGAKIYQDDYGATVLHLAVSSQHLEIVRLLQQEYGHLFCKAEVLNGMNKAEYTMLQTAAVNSIPCIHELLLAGADIDARKEEDQEKDRMTRTALAVTIENSRYDITKYLLEKGASPFCRGSSKMKLWSFLTEALYWCGREHANRVKLSTLLRLTKPWIDKYDLFNVRDYAGRSIVHMAIFLGQAEGLKALVDAGASWDVCIEISSQNWRESEYVGLNSLSYAKALPMPRPDENENLDVTIPWVITEDDMDAIIKYLISISNGQMDEKESVSNRKLHKWKNELVERTVSKKISEWMKKPRASNKK